MLSLRFTSKNIRGVLGGAISFLVCVGVPDLEHAKIAVIVSLRSFESQRKAIGTRSMSL
jgi:hypothetical protein